MQNNLKERELCMMRRIAGRGSSSTDAETAEDEPAIAALRKKGFVNNNDLTKDGWKALREVDDDAWSD